MAKDDELLGACSVPGEAASLHGITTDESGRLDAVDLPIIVIDGDCRVISINRAAATVLGLTNADIGRPLSSTFAGVENLDRLCAQVIADGAPCRRETRQGDRCFLLRIARYTGGDGQILGAVLTFTNVTAFRASIDQAIYEREYTKAILNTVSDPLVVLDAELRVQTANRAFYAMFGVSRDETQGVSVRRLGDRDWESSEVWKSIETTFSEQTDFQPVEIDREFPGIGRRTVVLEARRLAREGDALVLLAFQDITERKRAEQALGEQAGLLDLSFDAIFVRDAAERITYWNKGATELYGYTREEALGRVSHELLGTEFPEALERIMEQVQRESRWSGELTHKRNDGTSVVVASRWALDRSGRENQHIVLESYSDITRHKRSERALHDSERRYRTLFDVAPIGVYSCDAAGVIQEYNNCAAELWGRKPELGDTDERFCGSFKLFRPDGSLMPHAQCPMADVLSGKLPGLRGAEVHMERPDGSRIVVNVNIAPQLNERGQITGAINCFYDVTERKQVEERLRTLANTLDMQVQVRTQELERRNLEILEQTEQLRELSNRLLQSQDDERRRVARELHDGVGQLLAAVNMNLSTLDKESYSLSLDARRSLVENSRLIEQAVREIRTISHLLHPPMLDEIGLESALRWYVGGFAERSKIGVNMQLAPGFSKELERDVALSLFRIVQECLINIHRHSGSKSAFVGIGRSTGEITLEVKDDGKGISPELQAKIAIGAGTGVGLRGIRERIQQLGGRLEIDSNGHGTRIGAVLPVTDSVALDVSPIPSRTASA